jgi:hypothetical protein
VALHRQAHGGAGQRAIERLLVRAGRDATDVASQFGDQIPRAAGGPLSAAIAPARRFVMAAML